MERQTRPLDNTAGILWHCFHQQFDAAVALVATNSWAENLRQMCIRYSEEVDDLHSESADVNRYKGVIWRA